MSSDPLALKRVPSDVVPRQMLLLLVELLRSKEELPELAIGGAWSGVYRCMQQRPGVVPAALEVGLLDLVVEHLRKIGSLADIISISRGKAGRGFAVLAASNDVIKGFQGQEQRPDLEATVSSGVFDICLEIIEAFASVGTAGVQDTVRGIIVFALAMVGTCRDQPNCEARIRRVANALSFCLSQENELEFLQCLGISTSSRAAQVCCSVFGRDEKEGSEFTFAPHHIQQLTDSWSLTVRAVGWKANLKPTHDTIFAAELCVSDANKPLLIANKDFIPYLVDALLLDPEHPRAGMKEELKIWCQQHHCEALAQLAVFKPSRDALLRDVSVVPALETVTKAGLSEAARELAAAALSALGDKELEMLTEGQKHVMLSCEFASDSMASYVRRCPSWHLALVDRQ